MINAALNPKDQMEPKGQKMNKNRPKPTVEGVSLVSIQRKQFHPMGIKEKMNMQIFTVSTNSQ